MRMPARLRSNKPGPVRRPAPDALLELARMGPARLTSFEGERERSLRIATVIPSFRRGSGGHATIVALLHALRRLGHEPTVWLEDWEGRHAGEDEQVTRRTFRDFFDAGDLPLHCDYTSWTGADVVLATGWQTVPRALLLGGVCARAYLVQDHEPDFYGASADSLWAAQTYRHGLHCIAASRWLAQLLERRYGARTSHFDLALDHELYASLEGERRRGDLVVFYARAATPRRAVPLGLLALQELALRRPDLDIVLFGESGPCRAPFAHRNLGVLDGRRLASLYRQATVGIVLSLTNPSLVGLEMMACGLPCVELASESMLAEFGPDGPLALSEPDPLALCAAVEALLDDPHRRRRMAEAGLMLAGQRTWRQAAEQVERGLRSALADPS